MTSFFPESSRSSRQSWHCSPEHFLHWSSTHFLRFIHLYLCILVCTTVVFEATHTSLARDCFAARLRIRANDLSKPAPLKPCRGHMQQSTSFGKTSTAKPERMQYKGLADWSRVLKLSSGASKGRYDRTARWLKQTNRKQCMSKSSASDPIPSIKETLEWKVARITKGVRHKA